MRCPLSAGEFYIIGFLKYFNRFETVFGSVDFFYGNIPPLRIIGKIMKQTTFLSIIIFKTLVRHLKIRRIYDILYSDDTVF